jgi:predicted lactoylglutathione lyase
MIGYVTVGTNDIARAAAFYDSLFSEAGEKRLIDTSAMIAWGKTWEQPMFAIAVPEDGAPATPGHGTMVALLQTSRGKVDALHTRALSLGAVEESAPTLRGAQGDQGFYAGYCRDLDGNRLCLFFLGER